MTSAIPGLTPSFSGRLNGHSAEARKRRRPQQSKTRDASGSPRLQAQLAPRATLAEIMERLETSRPATAPVSENTGKATSLVIITA